MFERHTVVNPSEVLLVVGGRKPPSELVEIVKRPVTNPENDRHRVGPNLRQPFRQPFRVPFCEALLPAAAGEFATE